MKASIISIETKGTITVTRKYDRTKYNDARLQACASELTKSLKNHKAAANAFIKQAAFKVLSSKNYGEAFDEMYKKIQAEYTPEIKRVFALTIKHFKGQLPPQSELDTLDVYKLLTPKASTKKEAEHGASAVLAFIADKMAKLKKSKKEWASEESQAWEVAFNALQNNIKEGGN